MDILSSDLNMAAVDQAFGHADGLYQRILKAIETTPQHRPLFEEIALYHLQHCTPPTGEGEPAAKKRKLPNGVLPIHPLPSGQRNMILECPEMSFSIPRRGKFTLGVYQYPSSGTFTLAGKNAATGEVEFEMPMESIGVAVKLPVPEKTTKQWNYVFLPKMLASGEEGIVFTVTATGKQRFVTGNDTPTSFYGAEVDMLDAAIEHAGLKLVTPDEVEFSSATPEAHRKSETAYHVKAFRGSKDGFLFFLGTGIFFGFKKPLFFARLEDIESVSYTSVLQRTFNMVITYMEGEEEKEVEFSMLDQADYAGINGYVGRHELSDRSLAEARRAKMMVKKKVEGQVNGAEEEDDGRTELEKVEAQLQDEEDEMEEDFELDSDDSDGSGGSDDEEFDGDLVKEELGSEAEDISDEEEEQEEGEEEEEEEEEVAEKVKKPVRKVVAPPVRKIQEPDPDDDDQL